MTSQQFMKEERLTPEERRNLSLVYSVRMNRRMLAYDARPESEAKLQTVRMVTGVTPDCMDFSRVPRTHGTREESCFYTVTPVTLFCLMIND